MERVDSIINKKAVFFFGADVFVPAADGLVVFVVGKLGFEYIRFFCS